MTPTSTYKPDWQRALIALSAVTITVALVAGLHWARSILVPLALAVFFTFVLSPVVRFLQHRGLGRVPAVVLAVVGAGLSLAGTFAVIGVQIVNLVESLPEHEQQITAKIERVRGWVGGTGDSRLGQFFDRLEKAVSGAAAAKVDAAPAAGGGPPNVFGMDGPRPAAEAVVVPAGNPDPAGGPPKPAEVVVKTDDGWAAKAQTYGGPLAELAGQFAFAGILVVFMLIKQEDLRNRFLRLLGRERVTTATKAVDDASKRVSRYLLSQLLLNVAFGLVIAVGLFVMGVKYSLLWGFFATLMRYVPYVGTWIGVLPPLAFAFATSEGFGPPLAVFALFIGLEAFCNNVLEPRLYGTSLGMSEVAQLVAAAFWSFLWGPIGLILSGPLTTCLLVIGKYSPRLHFLEVMLGDEPPLEPAVAFFQRLAARDQDEAERILDEAGKEQDDPVAVFDKVVLPALVLTRATAAEGELDPADEKAIYASARELVDGMDNLPTGTPGEDRVRVYCCPAQDDADTVATEMLANLLSPVRWEVKVSTSAALAAEMLDQVAAFDPEVVCVTSLPPGGLAHCRYLCKRLRTRFPDLKILVGRFGPGGDAETDRTQLMAAGVDDVEFSLDAARNQLQVWAPILETQRDADERQPALAR